MHHSHFWPIDFLLFIKYFLFLTRLGDLALTSRNPHNSISLDSFLKPRDFMKKNNSIYTTINVFRKIIISDSRWNVCYDVRPVFLFLFYLFKCSGRVSFYLSFKMKFGLNWMSKDQWSAVKFVQTTQWPIQQKKANGLIKINISTSSSMGFVNISSVFSIRMPTKCKKKESKTY